MFYYSINCKLDEESINAVKENRSELVSNYAIAADEVYSESKNTQYFFVFHALNKTIKIGLISRDRSSIKRYLKDYLKKIELKAVDIVCTETKFSSIISYLNTAENNDYIDDFDDVIRLFRLNVRKYGFPVNGHSFGFNEEMLPEVDTAEILQSSKCLMAKADLEEELGRIDSCGKKKAAGHPVHYLICTDNMSESSDITKVLLNELYSYNRIKSRRYATFSFYPESQIVFPTYSSFYRASSDAAIVVYLDFREEDEDDYASNGIDLIDKICSALKKYSNEVLTIFWVPKKSEKTKKLLCEHLGHTNIVEISDRPATTDMALDYLKILAKEKKVRTDKKLISKIETGKTYLVSELNDMYENWYSDKLKNVLFPQYKDIDSMKTKIIKAEAKGCAYDELMEMVGLERAKTVIKQALDYNKAQKVFADRGVKFDRTSMHMVFTGNPGTAKTSVARLFARIMRDNEVLSQGKLVECGRGDLVGKYVGWTATIVKKKFEEAKGSVLFIDEAYSLVDDRDGLYGDEAINTIVQEMENNRDEVVVIFAGYPDKMEKFLQKNPGLRSRIAYHVPFDDYSIDELCGITDLIAKKKGLILADDAKEQLSGIYDIAVRDDDFGNGRYVRNVLEKAKMAQASRLVTMDYESITMEDVKTIVASDIEMPPRKKDINKFGFVA